MRLIRFARRDLAVVLNGGAIHISHVEGGIQDAASAAETLGFIERGIGFPHQRGLVERRAVSGGAPALTVMYPRLEAVFGMPSARTVSRMLSATFRAASSVVFGSTIANSSPP